MALKQRKTKPCPLKQGRLGHRAANSTQAIHGCDILMKKSIKHRAYKYNLSIVFIGAIFAVSTDASATAKPNEIRSFKIIHSGLTTADDLTVNFDKKVSPPDNEGAPDKGEIFDKDGNSKGAFKNITTGSGGSGNTVLKFTNDPPNQKVNISGGESATIQVGFSEKAGNIVNDGSSFFTQNGVKISEPIKVQSTNEQASIDSSSNTFNLTLFNSESSSQNYYFGNLKIWTGLSAPEFYDFRNTIANNAPSFIFDPSACLTPSTNPLLCQINDYYHVSFNPANQGAFLVSYDFYSNPIGDPNPIPAGRFIFGQSQIPEPNTMGLVLLGWASLAGMRRVLSKSSPKP